VKLIYGVLGPLLGLTAAQALACYTVYDSADRVVYQSEKPPVDMSRPLHETLPPRFHMIFDGAAECAVINSVALGAGGRTLTSISPLLTEQRTARSMGLPHTVAAQGVAVVQPRDAVLAPGVTVLPSPRIPSAAGAGASPNRGAPARPTYP
jgi:hypothetical protein